MDSVENMVRLALAKGVGTVTVNRMLAHLGSSDAILGAGENRLREVDGMRSSYIAAVREAASIDPRPELELAAENNVRILTMADPEYPQQLKETYDPPFILYVKGELKPTDGVSVGVVGTRRASHYGREQAERFGSLLARHGFTVNSGLARGVDSFAHRGALMAKGRTVAVIGSGFMNLYPEENRDLATEISTQGAVISECTMESTPTRESFPRRNRIIAGLSLGVLVIEAPLRSGALITARHAYELNREVFAVPGRIDNDNSAGANKLIRDGAVLVTGLDDILSELGPVSDELQMTMQDFGSESEDVAASVYPRGAIVDLKIEGGGSDEDKILSALGKEPVHIDTICSATGLPISQVSATLMIMEIKRLINQQPGKFFVKAN